MENHIYYEKLNMYIPNEQKELIIESIDAILVSATLAKHTIIIWDAGSMPYEFAKIDVFLGDSEENMLTIYFDFSIVDDHFKFTEIEVYYNDKCISSPNHQLKEKFEIVMKLI